MVEVLMPRVGILLGTGILGAILIGSQVAAGPAAKEDGWYSQAQAEQGHQLFNNQCAQCHRPDLTGAMGPALIGDAFFKRWGNKPLGDLFDFEHSKMPAINPGSVPDDQMWAITAYILEKNGFPAGATALAKDSGADRILTLK